MKSIEDESDLNLQYKTLDYIPSYCMPQAIIANPVDEDSKQEDLGPEASNVSLINNLWYIPKQENTDHFSYEDPLHMNVEKLAFTSGKKLWQLKHWKWVKKSLRKDKKGYIGS